MWKNILLKGMISVFLLLLLVCVSYVIYLMIDYNRIDDFTKCDILNPQKNILTAGEKYEAITYNIGFGAYNQEYSFFLDTDVTKDGKKIVGKSSRGKDKETVMENTNGSINLIKPFEADFYLLQEVDTDSTRSYHINQHDIAAENFLEYTSSFASNFHSGYLFYPFTEPHGKSNAGLMTLSKYTITQSIRRKYPIDESFPGKFFDLDRCFSISKMPVDNNKELVIINNHMSAYDKGGLFREQQLNLLNEVMADEYKKGNYVIVGGDFNHDIANSGGKLPFNFEFPKNYCKLEDKNLTDGFKIVIADNSEEIHTCRHASVPYEKGVNYTSVIDGFIISDNIEAVAQNIDTDFMYSDHNPVKLSFKLSK